MRKETNDSKKISIRDVGNHLIFLFICVGLFWSCSNPLYTEEKTVKWPQRVLLTNDDGINEKRIWALAKAFSKIAETYIVASFEDRSGSSNIFSIGKYKRSLYVERDYMSKNLIAYGVAGYPADCVTFGLMGLLKNQPPDLVVSGINGGPNLGINSWFGSGTIGAARTAAFFGVPAIAVSGLDDDDKEMVDMVTKWVVEFSQTKIVKELEPGQYLTISIPEVRPAEIKGIKIVPRRPPVSYYEYVKVLAEAEKDDETKEVWVVRRKRTTKVPAPGSDEEWYQKGYIVIVPMKVGEDDKTLLNKIRSRINEIPGWLKRRE